MKGLIISQSGGSKTEVLQIPLLSITSAPASPFATGSKYFNSADSLIYTAVTADTWTGAVTAAPAFGVIYTFASNYYVWDGDTLELTDVTRFELKANKTNSYTSTSETTYPSSKGLSDGLATKSGLTLFPAGKVVNVDNGREDTYTPDGTLIKPFKTIQAAIDYVASLNTQAYFTIKIKSGVYTEDLDIAKAGIHYLCFAGDGYVSISATAQGNCVLQAQGAHTIKALYCDNNIVWTGDVQITGGTGAEILSDVIWQGKHTPFPDYPCSVEILGANNFSLSNVYSENLFKFKNVNWSNIQNSQLQEGIQITADDTGTYPVPSWGADCTIQAFGSAVLGEVNYTSGGTATQTVAVIGSRWGSNTAVTIPSGVSIYGNSSFIRGTLTNNGAITLRGGATVENYVAGTGSLTIVGNPASQIFYDNAISGLGATNVKAALDELASGGGGGAYTTLRLTIAEGETVSPTGVDLSSATDIMVFLNGQLVEPNDGENQEDYGITTAEGESYITFNSAMSRDSKVTVKYI